MSKRLYIGHLPPDVRRSDLEDLFKSYGKIVDISIKGNFGFAEWETVQDAEDVMKDFHGKSFMGERLIIEPAKEARPREPRDPYGGGGYGGRGGYGPPPGYGPPGYGPPGGYGGGYGGYPPRGYGPPGGYDRYGGGGYGPPPVRQPPRLRRGEFRIVVSNLPPNTSWQDLKDVGREYGQISFADVDPSRPDEGVIEYDTKEDFERAMDKIEGFEFRGNKLRADAGGQNAPSRGRGGDDRDDRRDDRDDRRDDRDFDRRGGDDDRRERERERSPARRRDDDREPAPRSSRYDSRSPPPRRERDGGDDEPRRRDFD